MTRISRAVLALTLFLLVMLAPVPAQAFPGDCKEAPVAKAPGGGVSAFFFGPPETIPTDPEGGAFRNGAPIYANYGVAGKFQTYDLGCGNDMWKAPDAVIGTALANWTLEATKFGAALTLALTDAAYEPTFLSTFDPTLRETTRALRRTVFDPWVLVSLLFVGVVALWAARKRALSKVVTAGGWAVIVMVVATAVFSFPVKAGHVADEVVGDVVGSVHTGINGQGETGTPSEQAGQSLTSAVLYQQWKMGTFGRGDSATAAKYAKPLWTCTHLTWAEAALSQSDPDAYKDMLDEKADLCEDTYDGIKDTDPSAYEYVQGKESMTRLGAAGISVVALICTAPFLAMAALLMIGAYLIIRLLVILSPVIAVVGVAKHGVFMGALNVGMAAVINSIVFGIGAALNLLMARILLNPASSMPLWLALALMFIIWVILWVALKPARKLTTMVKSDRLVGDAAGAVGSMSDKAKATAFSVGKTATGVFIGKNLGDDDDEDEAEKRPKGDRSEGQPDATPAPATTPAPQPEGAPVAELEKAPIATPYTAPGKHRADVDDDQPAGVTYPMNGLPAGRMPQPPTEDATVPQSFDIDANPHSDVFVPGGDDVVEADDDLPMLVEPQVDEQGETVYSVFTPDEAEAGDR